MLEGLTGMATPGDLSDFVRRVSEKLDRPKVALAMSMNDIPSVQSIRWLRDIL
jgi:hypothetical protein